VREAEANGSFEEDSSEYRECPKERKSPHHFGRSPMELHIPIAGGFDV
jgi:hypothetical protein